MELKIEYGEGGKRFAPQAPGEIGGAGIGVGSLEGREHGSAPQARSGKMGRLAPRWTRGMRIGRLVPTWGP
ncbi:hypothetical protein TPA0910_46150 [Streptomyces hygroscopicus subsp. sporocinereus]|uniref:Uncharacterized protein n=1 Tax=Streptomyces hygroscopicus TaxID=1912 RepID=A0ABQ3U3I2_STRHY|nr:hypothetical protein TPA0910_46150 [Streptomyces hygroscopicus]GLV78674.1 hypothetical protein Shyhy02_66740 [Streptomyces hygroscopicus subsp. hygroscopicus]